MSDSLGSEIHHRPGQCSDTAYASSEFEHESPEPQPQPASQSQLALATGSDSIGMTPSSHSPSHGARAPLQHRAPLSSAFLAAASHALHHPGWHCQVRQAMAWCMLASRHNSQTARKALFFSPL